MLQIVTRMYFRDGVAVHSTVHRDVLYTNRWFLGQEPVELPLGVLASSSLPRAISTVALAVTEHLEAEDRSGGGFAVVATGGTALVDDMADVLSFGLNATFSRDH